MAYTLENLDRVGVWYLDGPGHFAQIATAPTERAVAADGIRWLKVSKSTFNTALVSVQAVGTALRTHAQGATA